jgi:cell division protein FtsN
MQFTFSKTRFVLVLILLFVAAFLLFAGGYVTGTAKNRPLQPQARSSAPASGGPAAPAGGSALASSINPNVASQVAPGLTSQVYSNPAAQAVLNPNTAAQTQVTAATSKLPPVIGANPLFTQATYAATNSATNAVLNSGSQQSSTTAAAPAASPQSSGTTGAGTAAPPAPSAAVPAAQSTGDLPYVLQFGAFREQKPAKQLQATLKEKGLSTTILNMVDNDQRTWHMVRYGNFRDLPSASKAASDLGEHEGVQALVKRFDSL